MSVLIQIFLISPENMSNIMVIKISGKLHIIDAVSKTNNIFLFFQLFQLIFHLTCYHQENQRPKCSLADETQIDVEVFDLEQTFLIDNLMEGHNLKFVELYEEKVSNLFILYHIFIGLHSIYLMYVLLFCLVVTSLHEMCIKVLVDNIEGNH